VRRTTLSSTAAQQFGASAPARLQERQHLKNGFHGVSVSLLTSRIWLLGLAFALATPIRVTGQEAPEIGEGTRSLYRGDYEKALSLASQYVESHPESAAARILLARSEIAQGRYTSAYDALRQALELDPTNIDALYYLERLCTILSQLEFRQLLETAPGSSRAHQLMAESYLAQHKNDEAEKEYHALLQANPRSVEALDGLGELKRSDFKFTEALAYYTRALQVAPRDYTSAYGSGACHLYQHNPQLAIRNFRRALEIDPSSAAAHLALGDALLRAGDSGAAVVELKAATALTPNMRQAYTLLAGAYQRLGQTTEATRALKKAQELGQQEIRAREWTLDSEGSLFPPGRQQPRPAESPNPEP
jgi:tetratricopeptide (TPR) repeat protein